MTIKPVAHYEIPELVEQFSKFTGIDFSKLVPNHPLRIYYEEYEKWWRDEFQKPAGNLDAISGSIIDFAGILAGVRLGQHLIRRVKKEFVADIRDERNCLGVLFEIRMLTHLLHLEAAKLIENLYYRDIHVNGKKPDFMFTKKGSLSCIYVEGTRKNAKEERCKDDNLLKEDLVRSLKGKAENYKDLNRPLIYAVHVPEVIEFNRDKFRTELGTLLQEMFKDKIFRNLNCVVFSSYRCPMPTSNKKKGIVLFDSDLPNLSYVNGSVDPTFKEDSIHLFGNTLGISMDPSGMFSGRMS